MLFAREGELAELIEVFADIAQATLELQARDMPTLGLAFVTLVCGHELLGRAHFQYEMVKILARNLYEKLTSRFFAEGCSFRRAQVVAPEVWNSGSALAPSQPINSALHIATIAAILVRIPNLSYTHPL